MEFASWQSILAIEASPNRGTASSWVADVVINQMRAQKKPISLPTYTISGIQALAADEGKQKVGIVHQAPMKIYLRQNVQGVDGTTDDDRRLSSGSARRPSSPR